MVLSIGELIITPDFYIIRTFREEVFKIHRNYPNALKIYKEMIVSLIDQSDQSMNKTKDWSQEIPDANLRKEINELKSQIEKKETH